MALSPTGSFYGTTSGTTSSGQVTFSSLRVLSAGTFTIVASSTGITSCSTSSFASVNYAYQITTVTNNTTPTVNFSFTITSTIDGEDLNLFTGSCAASLSETGGRTVYGTTSGTTTTGSISFSIYLISTGSYTISVSCPASGSSPAVSGSVSVTLLTEILKVVSLSSAVRII